MNLSSRPYAQVNVAVRYRYNKRDVQTPTFDATEYVRFDAVPEEIEEGLSHQFDTSRQTSTPTSRSRRRGWGTLRAGYGHEAVERHGRGFSDVGENIFRVSFDTLLEPVRLGARRLRRRPPPRRRLRRGRSPETTRTKCCWTGRHAADAALLRRSGPRPEARLARC